MNRRKLIVLVVALVAVAVAGWWYSSPDRRMPEAKSTGVTLYHNLHLWNAGKRRFEAGAELLVERGKITAAGSQLQGSDGGYHRVDLQGAYVVPGLIDMHVHINDPRDLLLNLSYGVTTVRNMRGAPKHLRWKQAIASGDWLGANLYTSSPVLDGERYAHALQKIVRTPEQARQLVKRYHARGYDLIKAYGYLEPEVFAAVREQAAALAMPVAKHGPAPVPGAELASIAGMNSLEHAEDIYQLLLNYQTDVQAIPDAMEKLRAVDAVVVPTLVSFDHLTQLSIHGEHYVRQLRLDRIDALTRWLEHEFSVARWLQADTETAQHNMEVNDFLARLSVALYHADIPILVGSDAGTNYQVAGISTHRELQLLHAAGLPATELIYAATTRAAQVLGAERELGCLAAGCRADFLVLARNPVATLTALAQPRAVVRNGQYLSAADLTQLQELASRRTGYLHPVIWLLEDLLVRWLDG